MVILSMVLGNVCGMPSGMGNVLGMLRVCAGYELNKFRAKFRSMVIGYYSLLSSLFLSPSVLQRSFILLPSLLKRVKGLDNIFCILLRYHQGRHQTQRAELAPVMPALVITVPRPRHRHSPLRRCPRLPPPPPPPPPPSPPPLLYFMTARRSGDGFTHTGLSPTPPLATPRTGASYPRSRPTSTCRWMRPPMSVHG